MRFSVRWFKNYFSDPDPGLVVVSIWFLYDYFCN